MAGGPGTDAPFLPLCVPWIAGNEWAYLKECLDTNWVSSAGSFVDRFEHEVASLTGVRHAVATTSGTAALHIALLLAGVEPEDEVLVSTLSFIAPANAVRYVGAWPVFIDCDGEHWQISTEQLAAFLRDECRREAGRPVNRATGRRVKAILPVHILGHPADTGPLLEVAEEFGLEVVEDATECLGARAHGRSAGTAGRFGCLSFNGNKIVTTGGGGMILTDEDAAAARARYLTTQAKDDPLESIHGEIGYNYRLTNLQAAMGCAQLERLDAIVASKRETAAAYSAAFRRVPGLRPMAEAAWAFSTFWMYTLLVDEKAFGIDSRELARRLGEERIESRPLWQPLHRSPAHQGARAADCRNAERIQRMALSLPCSAGITPGDRQRVIEAVLAAGGHA